MVIKNMKHKFLAIILVASFAFIGNVYAAQQGGQAQQQSANQGEDTQTQADNAADVEAQTQQQIQQRLQDGSGAGDQTQNQNQVSNQGEEKQLQNSEQEGQLSAVAQQRRSQVANAVQTMLQVADRNAGIGQQVRTIAQAQNQNQEKLEASLQKVQKRSGLAKFFVGPNYGEINNAEQILEQNRQQIRELNEIKNELVNQSDQQTLTEQIQFLEQANLEIEDSLDESQKGFSLFGWVFRMFSR